jgi:hypothetical protein
MPVGRLVGKPPPPEGFVPVPLRDTVCGEPESLSLIDSVPVLVPVAEGVKVIVIVQEAPAPSELPQVEVREKSEMFAPRRLMLLIASAAVPVLLRIAVCVAVAAPIACDPKERLAGVT